MVNLILCFSLIYISNVGMLVTGPSTSFPFKNERAGDNGSYVLNFLVLRLIVNCLPFFICERAP